LAAGAGVLNEMPDHVIVFNIFTLVHNAGQMNSPSPVFFFSICAVVDFAFGYFKWHGVGAGLVSIVCGLPLTAFLFLGFRVFRKDKD
jgi:hypothetical protein